jgi:predicted DNA-binding protein
MAVSENVVFKKICISQDLDKSLKKLAHTHNLTEAEIIQHALEKYLTEKQTQVKEEKENFLLTMAGLGKDGPKDGARYHDKYIYGRK